MSTHDVPGYKPEHHDVLAMGCWAEHDDGSLILVESVEGSRVVYNIFDLMVDPPVEYRDAMPEDGFKQKFSWRPGEADDDDDPNIMWTWHDKTRFPWHQVMDDFPSGQRHVSAASQISAAQRVARALDLRAQEITDETRRSWRKTTGDILSGIAGAIDRIGERVSSKA